MIASPHHVERRRPVCANIEKTLGKSPAYRKVDDRLYVVKQGSSYVMISVVPSGQKGKLNERALVRVVSQVVSGVNPEPSLFRQLFILNGQLRFGAFAFVPDGNLVMFGHSILGGNTMDIKELVATVHDVALVADEYDDRIVARYGGARMQDVIEEKAMSHLFGEHNNPKKSCSRAAEAIRRRRLPPRLAADDGFPRHSQPRAAARRRGSGFAFTRSA